MNIVYNIYAKCREHGFALLCICVITVISFLPTFTNGFQMKWDDQWMVFNPLTENRLDFNLLKGIFTTPFNGQWGPLNQLMYTLLYGTFGYVPMPFHTACLAMHLLNVYFVYMMLYMLLTDCTPLSKPQIRFMVLLSTTLFAIHPLQVESVAWISASKILMSTMFYLSASITFMYYARTGRPVFYVVTLLLFTCSYLSKENVMTFPLWTTMIYAFYGHSYKSKRFWYVLIPIYVLTFLFSLHLILFVSSYDQYIRYMDTYSWWQRAMFLLYSLAMYVYKWVFPVKLSWMYLYPSGLHETLPWWMMLFPAGYMLLFYLLWEQIRKHVVSASLLFTLVHLLFVLHITVLPRSGVVADRYMYLPILGLNVLLSYDLTSCIFHKRYKHSIRMATVIILVACGGLTYSRTGVWHDSDTLRKDWRYHPDMEHVPTIRPVRYL